ncbi:TadE/TadG family type IV pilus assembly protein [Aeromicrobium sp.]|uniref:TadE/TadG family type IV pilus assembly protein n=1 Tax=Aeromicrobium sp. TaxID=1871063 RepID=UPI0028A6CED2|nr:TadE/TadG family type IV pilus assembly protein [Aeromicrobium sp.]
MKRSTNRDERGAAAVEFALIAPLLVALIMGIVEFGVAINFKSQLNNATSVAARDYGIYRDKAQAEAIINAVATTSGTSARAISYVVEGGVNECNEANVGKPVVLTVKLKRTTITKILGAAPLPYEAKAVARCN